MHMRLKQKVRSASRILQTNLLELNLLQASIVIIDPMSYQSTHFLYTIYIENSPMDLSRESQISTNTSEFDHQQRWEMTRSLHESLSKVQGRESLIFQKYVTFSIDFPNVHITIICLPMFLIYFFCYFGKQKAISAAWHLFSSYSFGYCF